MTNKPSKTIKKWLKRMAMQGVDIRRLSVRDYAIHLMLTGGANGW